MKVLVIGRGGRCHAIIDSLSKSSKVSKIYAAPGNAGIASQAELVNISETDVDSMLDFAKKNVIDLTVVGPEVSLEAGMVDEFTKNGLKIFGPTKAAARIETSKEFAKNLMVKYNIPTASFKTFSDYNKALEYVKANSLPTVIKYDGLAAGKGVVIAKTIAEADEALKEMLVDDVFGNASVLIEDYLEGPEFSLMCFVDGDYVYPMPVAQDHKRAYDNDLGPNTGGMGAYSNVDIITDEDIKYAVKNIMEPAAHAMVLEQCPFKGVLYGGLMKTKSGIKVIEFNARFGDPETEVVLPKLKSDIFDVFCGIIDGNKLNLEFSDDYTIGIVLASKGYPGKYEKGFEIKGLDKLDSTVYHMGTAFKDGKLVTAGGRVLIVVGKGRTLSETRQKVLDDIAKIDCDNLFYRKDIGHQSL